MGLFSKKKKVEEPVLTVSQPQLTLTLDESQARQFDIFKEIHMESCNAPGFDIIARIHNEKGVRFFVRCMTCDRGKELVGPQTPPTTIG